MDAAVAFSVNRRPLSIAAVLGLTGRGSPEWLRLRGMQYAQLARVIPARLGTQAIAVAMVLWIFAHIIAPLWLGLWLAGQIAVLGFGVVCDRGVADADRRRMSDAEFYRHTAATVLVALMWAVPVLAFARFAPSVARLELWTILAMLMTVSAVVIPAVPVATLIFSGIVGAAITTTFIQTASLQMAFIAAMFIATIALGSIEASRNFLLSRLAEAGVAERNDIVSLLLGEHEEGEADWLWQIDTNRRVRSVSRRFAFALGMEPGAIEGQSLIRLIAGPAWEAGKFHTSLHDLADRLKARESFANVLIRATLPDGDRWWELSGTPKLDDNGNFAGFRGVGSDVTAQRESSDKIAYLARYDTLTGLPNRMMLIEAMGEAMRYAEQWRTRCAFLMIDLDRFKAVNDTLGHMIGDQLLASVSERLKGLVNDNALCGRLGGDEFAIVIRDASDLAHVDRIARAVIDRLSEPYTVEHHILYVGASVGSAIGPRDGSTVEELIRNADLALYRAKDDGGGLHHTYEPGLHAQAEERRKLEFSLRRALDNEEFIVHYQPVVDAVDEHVVSFEALIRWNSREHGMISPVKFIPLAEDTRLIVPIGEWVLREACREATHWPSSIKVAVNVSGEQLLDPSFMDAVVSALAVSGLAPQRLEIEVTESIFLRDATTARAALERIMALGCGVALDDFGTGYSSLGYLRKLRFSTIKIDRSFVKGAATDNRESVAIIRAVVAMADALEMSTTAEGVETADELAMIRKLGCKKIQGYYFGRPMVALDARALFTRPAKPSQSR